MCALPELIFRRAATIALLLAVAGLAQTAGAAIAGSHLEVIEVATGQRQVLLSVPDRLEAPHFSSDGKSIYFNRGGHIYCLAREAGASPVMIDTGAAQHCNNDHGLSPDGTTLVFGDTTESGKAQIYLEPVSGGSPRRVNVAPPAYWHGWSPDGTTLLFCGARDGNYDIYSIPVVGGTEVRLTTAPENDNGPDYSSDGHWIYFHSQRSGHMQVWRMHADGTGQEPVTKDDNYNWFPHPSPDGRAVLILSSRAIPETGHPPDAEYILRLLSTEETPARDLAKFFGGNGSLNVPCWSRDSRFIAFASFDPSH